MNEEQRKHLHSCALSAPRGPYELQTSNSFRRIGTARGDGDILCAVRQRSDGHPDLHAAPGVLEFVVAANPTAVIDLIGERDRFIAAGEYLRKNIDGYDEVFKAAFLIAFGQAAP